MFNIGDRIRLKLDSSTLIQSSFKLLLAEWKDSTVTGVVKYITQSKERMGIELDFICCTQLKYDISDVTNAYGRGKNLHCVYVDASKVTKARRSRDKSLHNQGMAIDFETNVQQPWNVIDYPTNIRPGFHIGFDPYALPKWDAEKFMESYLKQGWLVVNESPCFIEEELEYVTHKRIHELINQSESIFDLNALRARRDYLYANPVAEYYGRPDYLSQAAFYHEMMNTSQYYGGCFIKPRKVGMTHAIKTLEEIQKIGRLDRSIAPINVILKDLITVQGAYQKELYKTMHDWLGLKPDSIAYGDEETLLCQ